MAITINTNAAATLAANNLSSSNALLQRSLNRLSSGSKIVNPADDAGGLAVAMKLAATSRRQQAVTSNLGNATSYLQSQDGVLKTVAKVLERIGELKTLAADPTKNADDLANYDAEFAQLQDQISSLANETFNGIALFGTGSLDVPTTSAANSGSLAIGGADLLGVGAGFAAFMDSFDDLSRWSTGASGNAAVANTADDLDLLTAAGGSAWATSNQSFSGPFEVSLNILNGKTDDVLSFQLGGQNLITLGFGSDPGDLPTGSSVLTLRFDGNGSVEYASNGVTVGTQATSATSGQFTIRNDYAGASGFQELIYFDSINITSTATGSNVSGIASAGGLSSLNLATVTSALQEVATMRAENGAQQSRLGFAVEINSVNKANIEAAHSRIMDVDVAQESTAMAKYNILVQAGTSMLSQANQSAQAALRLIG